MRKIIGAILIIILLTVGYILLSGVNTVSNEVNDETQKDEAIQVLQKPDSIGESDLNMNSGRYESFSTDKILLAEQGKVVIFFHASWCPSCRALSNDIERNETAIPSNITILKTDYDSETELRKRYGVTTQHTLVQVDKDGELIKKWSGGSKLENLLSQII